MTAKQKIEILAEALMPFAAMHRIDDRARDYDKVVCERGTCEDKTIIVQGNFSQAFLALKLSGVPMTSIFPAASYRVLTRVDRLAK